MSAGALQTNLQDVPDVPDVDDADARRGKAAEGTGAGSTPAPLVLQPINTNVSFRDQAYAALKQAIMDADIYSHTD
jgi:hypothetical protein